MMKKKLWGGKKKFGCTIPLKTHHWQVTILKFWSRHFSYSRSVRLFSLLINQNILLLSFSLLFLLRLSPYMEGTFDGEILPFHRERETEHVSPLFWSQKTRSVSAPYSWHLKAGEREMHHGPDFTLASFHSRCLARWSILEHTQAHPPMCMCVYQTSSSNTFLKPFLSHEVC